MARRNRRSAREHQTLSSGTVRREEVHSDGAWIVATWVGRPDATDYTCPICGTRVAGGASHLVVWPTGGGVGDRRHVHTSCWRRRAVQPEPVRW